MHSTQSTLQHSSTSYPFVNTITVSRGEIQPQTEEYCRISAVNCTNPNADFILHIGFVLISHLGPDIHLFTGLSLGPPQFLKTQSPVSTTPYKRQTRPLVREGAPQRQDSKFQTELISGRKSQGGLDAKTYWQTVSRNVTSNLKYHTDLAYAMEDTLPAARAPVFTVITAQSKLDVATSAGHMKPNERLTSDLKVEKDWPHLRFYSGICLYAPTEMTKTRAKLAWIGTKISSASFRTPAELATLQI
jgi:hypothetical protein